MEYTKRIMISSNAPVELNKTQSHEFAKQIIHEISKYIEANREEYELWLKEDAQNNDLE